MSNPPGKSAKAGWGSFLSSAVSGLESRLDNILADENGPAQSGSGAARSAAAAQRREVIAKASAAATGATAPAKVGSEDGTADSRASSRSRTNDRLQERLAKAMNKGAVDGGRAGSRHRPGSPATTAAPGSDKATPGQSPALKAEMTPRSSVDSRGLDGAEEKEGPKVDGTTLDVAEVVDEDGTRDSIPSVVIIPEQSTDNTSARPSHDTSSRPSFETTSATKPNELSPSQDAAGSSPEHDGAEATRLQDEDKQRQEEMHAYLERIDALQAKLQYLAKQAAETAKQVAADADAGSVEQKLAEKDEQISLLMDEGLRMSKTELRLQGVIKDMRRIKVERDKGDTEQKKRLEKAERERTEALDARKKAEARIKENEAKIAVISRIERDVDELKREKEQAQELIRDLRRQLADSLTRAEEAERKAQSNKLEQERRKVAELKDELDNVKIEKKLAEDRRKAEMREAKEENARKEEKARMVEVELRNELANAETKLELLRSRTEEANSSASGDSHAKLLRQVETLQTQYALASENWQGIETTLGTRVATLEKERDDLAKRESDVRKKAREISSKGRRLEEELESVNEKARALEQDAQEQAVKAEKLQKRLDGADSALENARAELEREKKIWDADLQTKLEEERTKLKLELQSQNSPSESLFLRTDSPTASSINRKGSLQELGMLSATQNYPSAPRRAQSGRTFSGEVSTMGERQASRRPSAFSGTPPPSRGISASYINGLVSHQPPPIDVITDEDMISETPVTGTSSPRHRGSNAGLGTPVVDVMSASTVNAGPSVQLVERMSAAVRRLESEKASLKEELSRLSDQRDEAREEVVRLMRDAETSKEVETRLKAIEAELTDVKEKWENTLEMLGEREEQCEELKHDVLDLKGIIREMAEQRAQ